MNDPYRVKCIDARYDEDDEILILNCIFENVGQRLVVLKKSDFHYKHHGNTVPHKEMHKTAELFKGKPFYLRVEDDPEMEKLSDEEKEKYIDKFRDTMGQAFDQITTGLQSEDRVIERKKEDLLRVVRGKL